MMRCAAVALRAALLLQAPVLYEAYKDWQGEQQGASVTDDPAAAATAEADAKNAADPEMEWALEMTRKGAAKLGIEQHLEGCLPHLFSTEPWPSNSWRQFSRFVCDMLDLSKYPAKSIVTHCMTAGTTLLTAALVTWRIQLAARLAIGQ